MPTKPFSSLVETSLLTRSPYVTGTKVTTTSFVIRSISAVHGNDPLELQFSLYGSCRNSSAQFAVQLGSGQHSSRCSITS